MIFLADFLRSIKTKHFVFTICLGLLLSSVMAQTGVRNNGAKMIVNSGAIMKITGTGADYTNTSSGGTHGRINLDGKIEIQGDWTNNASSGNVMLDLNTDGTVVFNGVVAQIIGGTASTSFENLTVNNTSGLSLSSDINVRNIVTLTSGLLTLNASDLTIGLWGSIAGGPFGITKMFVTNGNGILKKSMDESQTFLFPIGEATSTVEYSPVEFVLTSGAFSSAWVGAKVTNAKHSSNSSLSEFLNRYWTLSSSGITAPVYDADFYYQQADVSGVEASVYAVEHAGATRTVFSTVDATNNILSVTGLSTIENTSADYTGEDGTAPTVTISTTESDPTNSSPFTITVTFNESVSGFDINDITVDNGSVTNFVNITANKVWTADITPVNDSIVTIDIESGMAQDIAGNDNVAAETFRIEYDGTSPNVNLSSAESSPTNTSPFELKIQFTEKVFNFVIGDISVTNGAASNLFEVETDSVWTVDITPAGDGTVSVNVGAGLVDDAAGNGNIAAIQYDIVYDGTAPTVSISSTESSPTNANPIPITISFNEPVNDFIVSDIKVTNGSTLGNIVPVTPNQVWMAEILPDGDLAVTVEIDEGAAQDAATNINTAATPFVIEYDGTKPDVGISGPSGPINSGFSVTITFDEEVNYFHLGDITVGNGSASNFSTGDSTVFTADITPSSTGTVAVDVLANVATDNAGNDNIAASQFSILYDETEPTVEISGPSGPINSSFSVTITFNEEVNYFHLGDITVDNGSASNFNTSDSTVFTADITPTTDGAVTVDVLGGVAEDNAGNGNISASQFSILFDDNPPTVSISSSESVLTNENPIPITITFNEDVTGFALGDIYVTNGSAGGLVNTTANRIWTANITPVENGTVTVDIDAGAAQDAATNLSTAATTFSIDYDGIKPGVEITGPSGPINTGFTVTITFDEEVNYFKLDSITVGNGTTSNFSTTIDSTVFTVDIAPSSVGAVTVDVLADVALDNASNGNTAASQYSIVYDNVNPTATYTPTDDATNVSLNTDLSINFSEDVVIGTGNVYLYETGVDVIETYDVTGVSVSGSGTNTITIDRTGSLTSLEEYHILIDASAFDDEAGNSFAGISIDTDWNFTATDADVPYILSTTPTDNALNVIVGDNLQITFSEVVDAGSGNINLYKEGVGTPVETFDVTTDISGSGTTTIVFDPTSDLDGQTDYYILIDATAFKDQNATPNYFPGIADATVWNFTTEDITAPIISSLLPRDDSVGVAIDSDLKITFDEDVAKGTGNIVITNSTLTPTQHESIDVTSGQVTIINNVATINSSIDFDGESTYYVEMPSGVFTDVSSNTNAFEGILSTDSWNFVTEDVAAPTVVVSTGETSPTNSSTFSVTLTFNEPVNNLLAEDISVTNGIPSNLQGGSTVYTVDISPSVEDTVKILVPAGAAQDDAGNSNEESNEIKLFYDITSPAVEITGPSGPIASSFDVTIAFNEGIVDLVSGNITVGGTGTASVTNLVNTKPDTTWVATITPTADGEITVEVLLNAVTDLAGNGNVASNSFIIEYDATAPIVNSLVPKDDSVGVAIDSDLQIIFNENILYGAGNITIRDVATSSVHYFANASEVNIVDNVVTITPPAFVDETEYYVEITNNAFKDVADNYYLGISGLTAWNFTTEDITPPTVIVSTGEASPTNSDPFSVTLTFNEPVNNLLAEDISVTNGTPSNLQGGSTEYTIDISPSVEDTVKISVPAGASQDDAGNSNVESNEIKLFYDITSPTVEITGPTGSIASSFDVVITFNEGMVDLLAEDITIGGTGTASVTNLVNTVADTVWVATITPSANGTITVDVLADAALDNAGNGNEASNTFTINYDGSGPEIIMGGLLPANGATDVSVSTNLQLTFAETVYLNTGSYEVHIYETGVGEVQTIDVSLLAGDGTDVITINPTDFNGQTDYYILIDAGAFIDGLGNGFAGISSATDWAFTTTDVDPPMVSGLSPVNGAPEVLVNSNLEITFNESVSKYIGSITIMNDDTDIEHETIDVTTDKVTVVDNVATINPDNDFESQVNYYVLVGQSTFRDTYNNNFEGITQTTDWNFFTEDLNPPEIVTLSPEDDANYVSLISNLEITFDENVVAQTGGTITIMNGAFSHEVIDITSAQVTVVNNIVTIDPSIDFTENTAYHVLISVDALQDVKGNSFEGIINSDDWNFTSGDYTDPEVISLSPDDVANVDVNTNLVITFNEAVERNSGNITIYNVTTGANHEVISVLSGQVSIASDVVTISPYVSLGGESDYYVTVEAGAFQDLSGNLFGGITSTTEWTFTTEDISAPSITDRIPVDNEVAAAVNTDLVLVFDEDIAKGSGNITVYNVTTSTNHEVIDVTLSQVTASGNTLTINPSADLEGLKDYYVLVPSTAVTDLNGNEFEGINNTESWNFTTADASAPIVNNFVPANNSSNVSVTSNLEITFNETVVEQTGGTITIINSATSVNHEVIDVTGSQVTVASDIVTINPSVDFDPEVNYHVLISNGAFQDTEGNNYGGIAGSAQWNFTIEDNVAPTIISVIPIDGAEDIAVDSDLAIEFTENIVKGSTGNITIMDADAGSAFATIAVSSDQITISASTATINPTLSLSESTNYYVLIDDGVFVDNAGNNFAGISDATYWNFKTVDNTAPTKVSLSPVDNASDVTVNENLVIVFNESVVANSGNITIMDADASATHETIDVTSALVTVSDNTVTINPAVDFTEKTNYYVLIGNDAFHDLSGNSFSGITLESTWNFTTGDQTVPTIVSVTPADDATDIGIDSTLQITFNENVVANTGLITIMNGTTTHESIDVLSGQVVVASNVVTIDPSVSFDGETNYHILIADGAFHDEYGNAFAGIADETIWNFVTEDVAQPTVTITSSESGTVNDNFDIVITFNELVTGFTSDDVVVANGSIVNFVETTVNLVWTATIDPADDGTVTIDVAAGVAQDAAGNVNTAATQFSILYESGVGFEDVIPYQILIYSNKDKVVVEFINDGNYQFKDGKIEVYNLLGQKIVDEEINDFAKFEAVVEHVSQIYVVKVILDDDDYTKRVYIE